MKKPEPREITYMEFEYTIRPQGHSGHITGPNILVGRRVHVTIKVVD